MMDTKIMASDQLPNESEQSTLQKHLAFWDRDHSGIISVWDTCRGLYELGFGVFSIVGAFVINVPFSYPSLPPPKPLDRRNLFTFLLSIPGYLWSYVPDPFFNIHIANIARDKHGSDSETYDHKGRFDRKRFEDIFSNYSEDPDKDTITFMEGMRMIKNNRLVFDLFGWVASITEWGATYFVLWPSDGRCRKDEIKGVFDGTMFFTVAERRKAGLRPSH